MRVLIMSLFVAGCATVPPAATVSLPGPAIFRAPEVAGPDVEFAAYVRIVNAGATGDRLLSLSCTCAERVEIHNTNPQGMHVLPHLDLPAGATTDVRPGGSTHLMLIGAKQVYRAGDVVQITLSFASGASMTTSFTGVGSSAEGWKAAGG